jgi:HD-GYP domain-containing protein (c-di-GMP phosphodiesterase class II)
LYLAAVVLAAAAALAIVTPGTAPPALATALILLGLMVLTEATPVLLPAGGYVSISAVLDLAGLIILGPVATAWISVIATVISQGLVLRKPPIRVVHNAAIFALTALAAGSAFRLAGGTVGRLDFPHDIVPLLATGAVYFLLNSFFVSTVIGLTQGPSPWRIWERTFLHGLLHHVSFVALGALLAFVYLHAGPWGLVLFGVPFVLARHSFKLYVELRTDLKEFVRALAEVVEEVDPYTRQHSARVAQYAVRLARALRRPEREIDDIECAALVHDLGKIGPQNQHILQKPGTLSHEEHRTLRGHPAAGATIVGRVRALRRAAAIVRYHHERPDGHGYPFGLRTQDVPLGARILNVADAFDAMTSDRPYRRALPPEAALRELEGGAGTQFDEQVVACLLALWGRGEFPLIPSPSSEELKALRLQPTRAS